MMTDDHLINIVEDYISEKRNGIKIDDEKYRRRLSKIKIKEDQINQILFEIEDDCDRELLAGVGIKVAKRGLVLSTIICLLLMIIAIMSSFGLFFHGRLSFIFFGGIAASILYGTKCYYEIAGVKQRIKRRELKWKKW